MGHVETTLRVALGALTLTGTLAIGVTVATASSTRVRTQPATELQAAPRVDADDGCEAARDRGDRWGEDRRDERRRPPATTAPTSALTTTISVTVPRVVMVRFDGRGRVEWARTNTGCAPQPGDLVYVVQPDGSLRLDSSIDVSRIDLRSGVRSDGPDDTDR